ncbi:MAG: hypothetical protein JWR38_1863 [Mucilaginibacter sp.]|nr:hypothetical protein [Mucilaginibacter sp.]
MGMKNDLTPALSKGEGAKERWRTKEKGHKTYLSC